MGWDDEEISNIGFCGTFDGDRGRSCSIQRRIAGACAVRALLCIEQVCAIFSGLEFRLYPGPSVRLGKVIRFAKQSGDIRR